jgi:hypothetical protein
MQEAGSGAVRQRLLGDELRRKVVIEVGNEHITDYRSIRSTAAAPAPQIPKLA